MQAKEKVKKGKPHLFLLLPWKRNQMMTVQLSATRQSVLGKEAKEHMKYPIINWL